MALSLARTGASHMAHGILEELVGDGETDEETLGLLARTCKDLWSTSPDPAEGRRFLTLAFQRYLQAYEASQGYWSGINAATTALLLGDGERAGALASRVRSRCLGLRASARSGEEYWILATLGEASLILRRWAEAEAWYREAVSIGAGRWGNLRSTRRNARLILQALDAQGSGIESLFPIPRVVAFSGHLVDRPGRPVPRFPPYLESAVREAMGSRLRTLEAGFGYAAAGCGGDILFLESIQELGAEIQVILPYERSRFRADSVDLIPGSDWGARFDRLLETATEVITVADQRLGKGGISYEYGFQVVDGLACLRADALDTELVCLALWDGKAGDGTGGTASSVKRWRAAGRRMEIIDVSEILEAHGVGARPVEICSPAPSPAPSAMPEACELAGPANPGDADRGFVPAVVGLLFADVSGFSRLNEEELPRFVQHFLGKVAERIGALPRPPLLTNTWGDGLYFVFQGVAEAGEFAMDLNRAIRETRWEEHGLPEGLSLRIALHAGPAYACMDPVTRRPNYLGSQVTMAARIEPVTPPGEVYASGAFAALARSDGVDRFTCGYVGRLPLAKGYGTIPMYVVHRKDPSGPQG